MVDIQPCREADTPVRRFSFIQWRIPPDRVGQECPTSSIVVRLPNNLTCREVFEIHGLREDGCDDIFLGLNRDKKFGITTK